MIRALSDVAPSGNLRIAVDAMGGDYAPGEVVKGAVDAVREKCVEILLVGDQEVVEKELKQYDVGGLAIKLVPSEGEIMEDEHPVQALKSKPKASIVVATQLVKSGAADALVSMGPTGGTMASAALILGTLEGLDRPCIGGPFLGLAPNTVAVDMGSNIDCRPSLMLGFASMGSVFAQKFLGIERPRVGLLSLGAEESKGNRQVREGYELFKKSNLNFIGNVEGMDFFTGKADVIVCDGFVGNILMKFTEGMGAAMASYLEKSLEQKIPAAELAPLISDLWEVNNLPKKMGGPLFGVNGTVIIGHGASQAAGVSGAIETARRCVEIGLVDSIRAELGSVLANPAVTSQ